MNSRAVTYEKVSFNRTEAVLLLMGSFTFAFLLGEAVHEMGHLLAHLAYGHSDVHLHLDPFGGSRIRGVTGTQSPAVMGVTSAAGPLFNLALALLCTLFLWRKRSPVLFPMLLWGPIAMVQEGVTFTFGQITPGGDAQWIAAMGASTHAIFAAGVLLLGAGIATIVRWLPVAGIDVAAPFQVRFLVVTVGICSLMLLRSIHSFLVKPESIVENLFPLTFSLLLTTCIVIVQRPLYRALASIAEVKQAPVRRPVTILALSLGAGMFLVQIVTSH